MTRLEILECEASVVVACYRDIAVLVEVVQRDLRPGYAGSRLIQRAPAHGAKSGLSMKYHGAADQDAPNRETQDHSSDKLRIHLRDLLMDQADTRIQPSWGPRYTVFL